MGHAEADVHAARTPTWDLTDEEEHEVLGLADVLIQQPLHIPDDLQAPPQGHSAHEGLVGAEDFVKDVGGGAS